MEPSSNVFVKNFQEGWPFLRHLPVRVESWRLLEIRVFFVWSQVKSGSKIARHAILFGFLSLSPVSTIGVAQARFHFFLYFCACFINENMKSVFVCVVCVAGVGQFQYIL